VLCGTVQSFAQQAKGPRTLEGLLNSEDAQKPAVAAAEADATDAGPKRPAGTVVRPKDGVQHPDLDKAWADYDAAVSKAAESIKAAINKQFDAATEKGDLDAADKWQTALEKFEKAGEVPTEKETKVAVNAATADFKKAKEELTKAYEAVKKALTMEKKIQEAKAVRGELATVSHAEDDGSPVPKALVNEWTVVFRSYNPADWSTKMNLKDRYAVPLAKAPRNIKFLRLKRLSNGNAVIIPMSDEMLGRDGAVSDRYGWAGANANSWGGHHLGVYENKVTPSGSAGGVICVHVGVGGFEVFTGWGFGHKVHANDRQYFSWGGAEISEDVFEISVKCSDLSPEEGRVLLK